MNFADSNDSNIPHMFRGVRLDLMERPFSQPEVKCLTLQLLKAVTWAVFGRMLQDATEL